VNKLFGSATTRGDKGCGYQKNNRKSLHLYFPSEIAGSKPNQGFSGRSLIWDVSPISHSGKLMMAQSLFDFPPSPATGESGDPPSDARS